MLSMLLMTIKTKDEFDALWEERIKVFGGVLQTEHQLLTNKEIYLRRAYVYFAT